MTNEPRQFDYDSLPGPMHDATRAVVDLGKLVHEMDNGELCTDAWRHAALVLTISEHCSEECRHALAELAPNRDDALGSEERAAAGVLVEHLAPMVDKALARVRPLPCGVGRDAIESAAHAAHDLQRRLAHIAAVPAGQ